MEMSSNTKPVIAGLLPIAASEPVEPGVVILAGGNGLRLRPLVRELTGDDRPKQFAAVVGGESLLAQTRRRAALLVAPEQTQIVLTRQHAPHFQGMLSGASAPSFLIQPENRGTATAVLYALLRDARKRPNGPVVVLPSDHWVSDDGAFMAHVALALAAVEERPDLIVLLGIAPSRPETGYGWIEPSGPIFEPSTNLRAVRSFVEKPSLEVASLLQSQGFLWNSFVVVGQVQSLLLLFALALPELMNSFLPVWNVLGSSSEQEAIVRLYRDLPDADFSRDVLARQPEMLAVLPVTGVSWDDLGDPARVLAVREKAVSRPSSYRPVVLSPSASLTGSAQDLPSSMTDRNRFVAARGGTVPCR
jgi:mannose-1-phosphate guanylyltransferase